MKPKIEFRWMLYNKKNELMIHISTKKYSDIKAYADWFEYDLSQIYKVKIVPIIKKSHEKTAISPDGEFEE
jgi:hypothetical protein